MADPATLQIVVKWVDELLKKWKKIWDVISKVPKDVGLIRGDLNRVQALLVSLAAAAAREELKVEEVRQAKQIKEAIFSMEDIIDDYESSGGWKFDDLGCAALPGETADFLKSVFLHLDIARRIYLINSKVQRIEESQEIQKRIDASTKNEPSLVGPQSRGGNKGNQDSSYQYLRRLPEHMKESQVVGLTYHYDELIRLLKDEQPECTVINVVGMGGAGKTTLARRVFKNKEVIRPFDCSAWITVSKFENNNESMLEDILKQFCAQSSLQLTSSLIGDRVKEYLNKKRYVVFFDDVWSEGFWGAIENTLDKSNPGSRIIITTRNKKITSDCKKYSSVRVKELEMQPLSEAESLKLFNDTALRNKKNPKIFQTTSYKIIEKCMHSPLGIVAIGREIAADKNFPTGWQKHVRRNADIAKILSFSYDDLPEHLKLCLLYFGMYPENYEVKSKRLVRQWIAEGFVKSREEEVARGYLEELIDRCLVQVSSFTVDGKAKSCRVHYLVRVMILKKIEDLSFCQFINEDDMLEKEDIIRRLSVATDSQERLGVSQNSGDSKIYSFMRSLLFFTKKEFDVFEYTARILAKSMQMQLKVLDFEGAMLCVVPPIFGITTKLKYLSFRNTKVETLPDSIGLLQNLETLDLRQTCVNVIPNQVSKLRKLRHLLGTNMSLMQLKDDFGEMKSLETVNSAKVEEDGGLEVIQKLEKLVQMRDLGLTNVEKEHGGALCSSLNKMPKLEKLHVIAKAENEIELHNLKKRPQLRKIHLQGKLSRLPVCIPQLEKLCKLVLCKSKLVDDPLPLLEDVDSLRFLSIIDEGYVGPSLHFRVGGFNCLKELQLGSLHGLNSVIIDSDTLQSLNRLKLRGIPQLNMVPLGIQYLGELKDFNIENMSDEFMQSIAVNEEHSIIKHVLRVRIDCKLVKDKKNKP